MKFYFNAIKINFNTKFIITIYLMTILLCFNTIEANKFIKKTIMGIENKKIVEIKSEKDAENNNLSINNDVPSELDNKKIPANRGNNLSSVSIVNGEPVLKIKTGKVFGNRLENEENSGDIDDQIDTIEES